MIVPDWLWRWYGHRWVTPFDPARVNPVSVDLTLAAPILIQRWQGVEYPNQKAALYTSDLHVGPLDEKYLMFIEGDHRFRPAQFSPGDSVLALTREHIHLPRWMRMQGMLKSSLAREGLNHRTALYVDPGFQGPLTLELNFDRTGYLVRDRPIIQVEAQIGLPQHPYDGHYQHQTDGWPTPNRNRDIAFVSAPRTVLLMNQPPTPEVHVDPDSLG